MRYSGLNSQHRQLPLALILSVASALLLPATTWAFFIDKHQSPSSDHWNYGAQSEWRRGQKQCGGSAQSPIDIQRKLVIQSNQLRLHFFNYDQPAKFLIQNAHHTIKMNPIYTSKSTARSALSDSHSSTSSANSSMLADEDYGGIAADLESEIEKIRVEDSRSPSRIPFKSRTSAPSSAGASSDLPYNGAPTIKLDWLDDGNNEYKLVDVHFHWAERKDNGSEHAIDGKRAAMEMHLVHMKHGLEKSKIGYTSDSLAVVAVLIESYRKSNADFNPIVNSFTRINGSESSQEIEYKSINDMLPVDLKSFYTYSGSLTTPPCYQVVNWIVMVDRLYMNAKQIEMFRNLYSPSSEELNARASASPDPSQGHSMRGGRDEDQDSDLDANLMMPNVRHIQPLNNRTILASFSPLSRLEIAGSSPAYTGGAAGHISTDVYKLALVVLASFIVHVQSMRAIRRTTI